MSSKSWINILIIFLLLLLPLKSYADYSSLSAREKYMVTQAFKQAKFYKYYQALVDGKDNIVIKKITRLGINGSKHIFKIEADIELIDETFKREFIMSLEIKIKKKSSFWDDLFKIGGGGGFGIVIGILICIVII